MSGDWEPIPERLARWAWDRGEVVAAIDCSATPPIALRYRQLWQVAADWARQLDRLGFSPGDILLYQLPNWWEFAACTLAGWMRGLTVCPLLPSLREHDLTPVLAATGARHGVFPQHFRGFSYPLLAQRLSRRFPGFTATFVGQPRAAPVAAGSLAPLPAIDPDQAAQLLFTSGTTGQPKGVLHTHRTLALALAAHTQTLGLSDRDRVLVASPMAHQTGFLYGMALAWYLGTTAVYLDIWDPERAAAAVRQYGVSFTQAAPPFLADLCALPDPVPLGLFVATGSTVPRPLMERARARLAGTVVGGWGSTESGLITVGRPTDPDRLNDGRPLEGAGIEAVVVDSQGRPLPAGQEGRLLVKAPYCFVAYLHRADWYRQAVDANGYFHTGDLAQVVSAAGHIRLTGRESDGINRGGEKIPVVAVEELLLRHPDIRDAALVAMPDPRLGERACAVVVWKDPAHPLPLSALTRYLEAAGLAKPYWPERLESVAGLPRTESGKVQKYRLRQWVRERMAADGAISASPFDARSKED